MIKKLAIALIVLILSHSVAFGYGITWGSVNGYLNYADGSSPLYGSTDSSLGCFVQLIWVGANGLVDQAYYGSSIDGTGYAQGLTDDQVVDYGWVGQGQALGDAGWFDGPAVLEGGNIADGNVFYLRTWTAPASTYASGYVPTASSNFYGNSATWTWEKVTDPYDAIDFTSTGNNINATLSPMAIPEPAMFGLGIVGLLCLRFFGRKQK